MSQHSSRLVVFLLCLVAGHPDHFNNLSIDIGGDVILGGLFPVHQAAQSTENGCGTIEVQPGFQYVLAMLSALEEINKNPDILPGIRLGAKIYDTCRSQTIGADRARDLLVYTLLPRDNQTLAAVIGPLRSDVAISVANLLRVFHVPLVSYGSTSPDLSNKEIYSYFLRTVPPSSFQAEALVDIMKNYGWSYVLTVYSAGNYGEKGMAMFQKTADRRNICIAAKEKVPRSPTRRNYRRILHNLLQASKDHPLNVVMLFCRQRDVTALLSAYKMVYTSSSIRFVWIASNAWGNRDDVTSGHEQQGDGALTLNHLDAPVNRFEQFLKTLTVDSYSYPWYKEFWQDVKGCSLTPTTIRRKASTLCASDEYLPRNLNITPVRAVVNSVYAVAYGLHNLWKTTCQKKRGMCDKFRKIKREILLNYIKNVSFPDSAFNSTVKFNKNGEVDGNYTVVNFRREATKFKYVNVGTWGGTVDENGEIQGHLKIEDNNVYFRGGARSPPESLCSRPCRMNQIKKPQTLNSNCCWDCKDCGENDIVINNTCVSCKRGHLAAYNRTICEKVPVVYPNWGERGGIALTMLSSIGILGVVYTAAFLIKNRNHQVIKAAGRELSSILLIGISLCYVTTVVYLTKPSKVVCGLRRCMGNLSLTVCYAPVLLKTNRIHRIFVGARRSTAPPLFVSPKWSILMSLCIISVQILLSTLWILSDSPESTETYPSKECIHLECHLNSYSIAVSLLYNVFLMVLCTIYAFKTRNFPRNFNEAKYVGVTMYVTCSISIIFITSYLYATDYFVKMYLLCGTLTTVGTITLLGLFGPKIWLVYYCSDIPALNQQPSIARSFVCNSLVEMRGQPMDVEVPNERNNFSQRN